MPPKRNKRKAPSTPPPAPQNPVIKSPLDTHSYKIVSSPKSGLRGLLISTCIHPREIDKEKGNYQKLTNCTFNKVLEFNKTYYSGLTGSNSPDPPTQQDDHSDKNGDSSKKKKRSSSAKVKCRRGIHENDDEMQTFCNNYCVAVLYVKAGFFQDPPDVQGMAHFCEHCVFLGSKNYPEPEQFSKFVEGNAGFCNAITAHEYTLYLFFIDHEQIAPALDIFADMFSSPLFHKKSVAKEIDNMNSEFEMKRLIDELRQIGILQSCIHDKHPAKTFGMGSKESLSDPNILEKLKQWNEQHYFGENMLFALQGPRTLPELEDLFVSFAEKMPTRAEPSKVSRPLGGTSILPLDMQKWNKMYFMDSFESSSSVTITWPLDPKFGKNFATKPVYFFTYIFANKGHGTLDWYLKQRGWITSISNPDSTLFSTEYFTMFSLYLQLTELGLQNRMDLLYAVFKYIELLEDKLLRDEDLSRGVFTETQQLQADIFHYRSDMNLSDPTFGRKFADDYVNDMLSRLLHVWAKTEKPEEVLINSFLVRKFELRVLQQFIKFMVPSRANIIFADQSFAENAENLGEEEEFYKTKYYTQPIPEEFVKPELFRELPEIPELRIPKPNPFIGLDLCFPHERLEKRDGVMAYDSEKGKVTYGNSKCQKGLLPSAQYTLDILSYALEDLLASQVPSMDILVLFFQYMLDVQLGSALSSLMSYEVETLVGGGLRIILSGPSPTLTDLAMMVFAVINDLDEHARNYPHVIEILKESQINSYKMTMEVADTCAEQLLDYLLNQNAHFLSDYVKLIEDEIDHENFISFAEGFKTSMFIEVYLNGCVSRSQSLRIAQFIDKLDYKAYKQNLIQEEENRTLQLPVGERCLLVSAKNPDDKNVFVLNYYQVECLDREVKKVVEAIQAYLEATVMEQLRTKQSLGYHTEARVKKMNGIYGIIVGVQGVADKHTSGYIDEQIDKFLVYTFDSCFATISRFNKTIHPLLIERDSDLGFAPTKNFFQRFLHPEGDQFRKLSVQIQGHKTPRSTPLQPAHVNDKMEKYSSGVELTRCPNGVVHCGISSYSYYLDLRLKNVTEENGYFITNVEQFKNDLTCLGNLENLRLSEDEDDDE